MYIAKLIRQAKKPVLLLFMFMVLGSTASFAYENNGLTKKALKPFKHLSKESATCASCHRNEHRSIYQQWGRSKHFGANVGCYECHKADASDPDAIRHKGFQIAVIVSPKDCAQCHSTEVEQFSKSHHAKAAEILGSLDNVLAEVVEGAMVFHGQSPVAVNGCWQCHGSEVKVLPNGDLDPTTWPNTGIGRINPDGSKGACTACHQRHEFSMKQARRPESCGKCHLGPDHPQKEIYDESKHGINFYANVDRMNLESAKWVAGEDYDAAPTCATCHMSATSELPITHDVGDRISWTLRPAISQKIDAKAIKMGKEVKPWLSRRNDMKTVCSSCHSSKMIENFYEQFDSLVNLYNNKFAKPGASIIAALKEENMITAVPFDEAIEWTWFFLWHHEGRRARHGAAMQAPDYVQWHGMYEVAHRFYIEMVPEIKELIEKAEKNGNHKGAERVRKLLDEILNRDEHKWFLGKMNDKTAAKRKAARAKFQKRYIQE
jgi:ssDNA-binding Zn-finger/Zn-ribbon topoisomerase 1